jgi:hypothetical protein
MIVYFWEKSKKTYIRWGTLLLTGFLGLYLFFIWTQIQIHSGETLQVIRNASFGTLLGAETVEKNPLSTSDQPVGEHAFVASKRGKYYYPKACSKAKTLSVKNMLYFKDKMSAEAAGFSAYSGCK